MDSTLAVVWVHYHTPRLLRESVGAVRSDLSASGLSAELVVVDNGGLDAAPEGTRLVRCERNTGYAGGVNRGVAETQSPDILVMNPDVLVEAGCISALTDALARYSIVSPLLFLDRGRVFRLPPTERRDFLSTCIAELGRHHPRWTRYARRRWRRHAHRHWRTGRPGIASYDLSGAILGFTRRAFETVGPWDEGYRLYFEETDWLHRARAMRLESAIVTRAAAVHLYAQSTRNYPHAEKLFAQSNRRYELKHFGAWERAVLRLIRAGTGNVAPQATAESKIPAFPVWAELSVGRCGYPAAFAWIEDPHAFYNEHSDAVRRQLPGSSCWLRWVDDRGTELAVMAQPASTRQRAEQRNRR